MLPFSLLAGAEEEGVREGGVPSGSWLTLAEWYPKDVGIG